MEFGGQARERPNPSPGGEGGSPKARRMRNGDIWQDGMHLVKMVIICGYDHFYQLQSKTKDIAIPHPPQCAHWGTFPSGEGFYPAKFQFMSQTISFAKLFPGVWYSTPSKSVTVAAMSAKLGRVPRLTGFTCGPRTSRGTYSRVWSVVAV